jgi:WD40-like Beta Propeller Repeat
VLMAGGRADGLGGFDLYVSFKQGKSWTKPGNLGNKINSSGNEYSPAISPDGHYFFWTSARSFADVPLPRRLEYQELTKKLRSPGNGLGDIYYIDRSALPSGP